MANRIRELRESQGMSQKEMGDLVHISQQSVSRIENNSLFVNTDVLGNICKLFHVTTDYILGFSNEKKNVEMYMELKCKFDLYEEFVNDFDSLNKENRQVISELMNILKHDQTQKRKIYKQKPVNTEVL